VSRVRRSRRIKPSLNTCHSNSSGRCGALARTTRSIVSLFTTPHLAA
jgi:hypothetical protein